MAYSVKVFAILTVIGMVDRNEASAVTAETNCTDHIIPEGESLTCECRVKPSNTTSVSLSWPGHSNTSVLTVDSVRRDDHDTVFTCLTEGPGITRNTTFTLRVAYGPSQESVSITGPSIFVTDGTRKLTLTCETGDMYPKPNYAWSRCASNTDTCTLTPKPDQDGERVICSVFNPATLVTIPKLYVLNLTVPTELAAPVNLIAGVLSGIVILAISVVVVVCTCQRKKARPPSKEEAQREQRPESVMYRNSYYISADELSLDSPIPPFYATPLTAPQEPLPTIHEVELNQPGATANGSSRKRAHENVTYAVGGCSGAGPAQQLQNGQSPALSASSMDPEPVYAVVDKSRKRNKPI